jgi:hypothetical protein
MSVSDHVRIKMYAENYPLREHNQSVINISWG